MEKTIEIKAIDRESAIARAKKILEINPKDDLYVEVIEKIKPKKKLFGLLGTENGLFEIKFLKKSIKEKNEVENKKEHKTKVAEVKEVKETKEVKTENNVQDETAKKIQEKTEHLIKGMNLDLNVKIKKVREKSYYINIVGKDKSLMIGQQGKTLNSFETLLNSIFKDCRIEVEVENFKEKRSETLRSLARKMAAKVIRNGKTIRLNAMPAKERKTIHEVLNKYPELETFSEGKEPRRYIVIKRKR